MSYLELLKKAWKSGDFTIAEAEASGTAVRETGSRERVRRQMEELAQREAGDAASCLNAHREGIMKLAPFVKFREEKFGAVLFETRSEKVYTLSPTGAAVVREVVGGADEKTLVSALKAKYDDQTGKMETEALGFLAQLKDKGLITE